MSRMHKGESTGFSRKMQVYKSRTILRLALRIAKKLLHSSDSTDQINRQAATMLRNEVIAQR